MWKTFVASPLAGGIAALLGWLGAILFQDSMTEAEFASLRLGWAGAVVGAVAIACALMLFLGGKAFEPLVLAVSAAVATAVLWNRRELPFATRNFQEGAASGYWFTVTMMILVFLLLLTGLRAARESNNRARG